MVENSVDKMVAYSAVWKGTSTADPKDAWSVVVTVDLKDASLVVHWVDC